MAVNKSVNAETVNIYISFIGIGILAKTKINIAIILAVLDVKMNRIDLLILSIALLDSSTAGSNAKNESFLFVSLTSHASRQG